MREALRAWVKLFPIQASGIGIGMMCAGDHPKYLLVGGGWIVAGLAAHAIRAAASCAPRR